MKYCLSLLLFVTGLMAEAGADDRPNILWIFSDDHAYQAIGAYGGRFQDEGLTPNIDRIAADGMLFEKAYVGNSICAPSRATLLTGKHSHLNGKFTNGGGFNHDQPQFQKMLQKHGYQTAMIGKIHLSGAMQGFDYWEVLPGQGSYTNPRFITEEGNTRYEGHSTDIITDRALNWLQNNRDKRRPFMAMVHYKAPHRNWTPAPRIAEEFRKRTFPEPETLFDDFSGRGVAAHKQDMSISKTMRMGGDLKVNKGSERAAYIARHNPQGDDLIRWKYQAYMQDYLGCIAGIDENVGRLLAWLTESGLEKNTVVMYSADQGFYLGEHGWFDKRFMYEESFRTPLVARWPGVISPGSRNTDLVQNIDFAETFLDIAGAPIPDDMQGKSLLPLLKGKTPDDWRRSLYYHYYEYPAVHSVRRHEGVFDGRYKLIRFYGRDVPDGEEWELFDLKNDPREMNSVYVNPEYAGKVEALKAELERLKAQYQVPEDGGKPATSGGVRIPDNARQLSFSIPRSGNIKGLPYLAKRGIEITVPFTYEGRGGVLIAQGGASEGYAFWIKDGQPRYSVTRSDVLKHVETSHKLAPGKHVLTVKHQPSGQAQILLDGKVVGSGNVGGAFVTQPREGLNVGADAGSPVTNYGGNSKFSSAIGEVKLKLLK